MSSFYAHHRLVVTLALVIITIAACGFLYIQHEDFLSVGVPVRPSAGEQVVVPSVAAQVYIYGPELNKVKVLLVSDDEKAEILKDNFCGGTAGSRQYTGHYKLVLDPKTATSDNPGGYADMKWAYSEVDLGELSFDEGTPWDRTAMGVDALGANGYRNFIFLRQYASCNGYFLSVFGYDFETGKLMRYRFAGPGAYGQDSLFINAMSKSKEGDLLTSLYNNVSGKTQNLTWIFDASAKAFQPMPAEEKFCGGIAGFACPAGYECKLDGGYPDAGGRCVKKSGGQVVCTQDAKQCPDGSYVSRTGPNCEFAACANATQ